MNVVEYTRGAVVKGPDEFGPHDDRPYVLVSDDSHPFREEEAVFAAVTTTERPEAVRLHTVDFESGGLPRESYVNPWTVVSLRLADLAGVEGTLTTERTDAIAEAAAGYLGIE